jgi:hypothetical protein
VEGRPFMVSEILDKVGALLGGSGR